MADTKVMSCTCKHIYQDKEYSGKRLHNKKFGKLGGYTCTVCGKVNKGKEEK